jgi:hypothetical protein
VLVPTVVKPKAAQPRVTHRCQLLFQLQKPQASMQQQQLQLLRQLRQLLIFVVRHLKLWLSKHQAKIFAAAAPPVL